MLGDDASAIAFCNRHSRSEQAGRHLSRRRLSQQMAYAHVCWGRRELDGGRGRSQPRAFPRLAARVRAAAGARCDHVDFVATCLNTLSLARRHSGDLDGCMAALREQLPFEQIVGHRMRAVCRATIADALLQRKQ